MSDFLYHKNMLGSIKTKLVIFAVLLWIFINPLYAGNCNNGSLDEYMSSLKDKIKKNWTLPENLGECHAVVVFMIDNDGNILSSQISKSSGNKQYDQSALKAVAKAAPYDKFPADAGIGTLTIQYNFDSQAVKIDKVKNYVSLSEKFFDIDNKMARDFIDAAIKEMDGNYASYFLYARRHKIDKAMGDEKAAKADLNEFRRLKMLYDTKRINICKNAAEKDPTAFAFFTLANAYDIAGDYTNAIDNIDKAIEMTELNNAYKRYRAEINERNNE